MDFEKILAAVQSGKMAKIVNDEQLTDYQKAANIAALDYSSAEPKVRKARTVKPKPPTDHGNDGLI